MNKIERAHQMYREGRYEEALGFYTEALGMAKTKPQKIALHSNRAACFLKLHDFKKAVVTLPPPPFFLFDVLNMAAEECTSVLELDQNHTGALMLRAQTLVTIKEFHSALFDVNRLMELNPSSEVYRNLQTRLKTQLSLAPIPEAEAELEEEEEGKEEAEPKSEKVVCKEKDLVDPGAGKDIKNDSVITTPNAEVVPQTQSTKGSSDQNSRGWQAIPKPKGHSQLDYSRWDRVEDESSEDEEDEEDEESQPRYRFRVRTVGVQPVK
ncbi:hypothetical protein U1Q18_000112 [Sarracenia purpurea var. burkii]